MFALPLAGFAVSSHDAPLAALAADVAPDAPGLTAVVFFDPCFGSGVSVRE